MTANDNKSYLSYVNKLVDQYSNTCHSIGKNPVNSVLTKKLRRILKSLNLK